MLSTSHVYTLPYMHTDITHIYIHDSLSYSSSQIYTFIYTSVPVHIWLQMSTYTYLYLHLGIHNNKIDAIY